MKSEPTPGPWRWGDWSAYFGTVECERSRSRLEYNPTHPGEPGAVVRYRGDAPQCVLQLDMDSNEEISDADRELVRRAPELRDALLEMLRDFGGNMDSGRYRELRALAFSPVDDDNQPAKETGR